MERQDNEGQIRDTKSLLFLKCNGRNVSNWFENIFDGSQLKLGNFPMRGKMAMLMR